MRWVTAALIALVTLPVRADDEAPGKRVALLVGINVYAKPIFDNLKYAERDVEEVGKELKALGFEVTTLTGEKATRQVIDDTALRLVGPLKKADVMLVMLCGHGLQLDVKQADGSTRNDAFFCPYDAVFNDPASLFSLTRLIDDILAPNVGRKLVLIDACRNDPDPARSASRGIEGKVIALPEDTAVMFSCRKGQKSFENDELRHGLFTFCVLEALQGSAANTRGDVDWTRLTAHVNESMASTDFRKKYLPGGGARQEPIPAGGVPYTVLGNRVKVPPSTSPVAAQPPTVAPSLQVECDVATRELLDRIVAAHGGLNAISKVWTMRMKTEGMLVMPYHPKVMKTTGEYLVQLPYYHITSRAIDDGLDLKSQMGRDREGEWMHQFGATLRRGVDTSMDAAFDANNSPCLASLQFLIDKDYCVALADRIVVEGRPTVGIVVTPKSGPEAKLYFDQQSSLLAKIELSTKGPDGKAIHIETIYADYRKVSGVDIAYRRTYFLDKQKAGEDRVIDVVFLNQVDPMELAAP